MKKVIFLVLIFLCSINVVMAKEEPKIILSDYTFNAQDSWYGGNDVYKHILNVDDNYIYFNSDDYWLDTIDIYDKNDLSKKVKTVDVEFELPDNGYINSMRYLIEDDYVDILYLTTGNKLYFSKIDYLTGKSIYLKELENENNISYINGFSKLNNNFYIQGRAYDSSQKKYIYTLIKIDSEGTFLKQYDFENKSIFSMQKDYAYVHDYVDNLYYVLDKDGNISEKGYEKDSLPYILYDFYDELGSYTYDKDSDGNVNNIKLYKDDKLVKEVDTLTIAPVSGSDSYNHFNSNFICTTSFCYLFRSRYEETFIDVYDRELNYINSLNKTTSNYVNSVVSTFIVDDLLYTIEGSGSSYVDHRTANIYGVIRSEKEINVKLYASDLVDLASTFDGLGEVKDLTWTVDDEDILKVVDGKISPLKTGETKIYTEVDGHYYYLTVKVTKDELVQPETVEETTSKVEETPNTIEANPDTFDSSILNYIIVGTISFLSILGSIIYENKHKI